MPPVTIAGFWKFSDGQHMKHFMEALLPLIQHVTDNEPETLTYSFYPVSGDDNDDPLTIMCVEIYASEEAFALHSVGDYYKNKLQPVIQKMIDEKHLVVDYKMAKAEPMLGFAKR